MVNLSNKGVRAGVSIHRLVLESFVGLRPAGMECRHLNGDCHDNRLENIVWGTHSENMADRSRHGRTMRGERHGRAKLIPSEVRAIRMLGSFGIDAATISRSGFGVAKRTIQHILTRRNWRHI